MAFISLPNKISGEEIGENEVKFIIEPCHSGFGTTLGNALRRVLLSSLEGAAIIKVKIKKVDHEFSTIAGVKEDVVQILMNLKKLSFKSNSDEPVKVNLKVKNKIGEVKVSDIEKNSDIEVMTKDFVIATLTDKKTELDMEFTITKGLGYEPVENRVSEDKEVGVLNVDAFFSPVRTVGFEVEPARVGQDINYDRLILTVKTDGVVTPQEAMEKSIDILLDHFNLLKQEYGVQDEKKDTKTKKKKATVKPEK